MDINYQQSLFHELFMKSMWKNIKGDLYYVYFPTISNKVLKSKMLEILCSLLYIHWQYYFSTFVRKYQPSDKRIWPNITLKIEGGCISVLMVGISAMISAINIMRLSTNQKSLEIQEYFKYFIVFSKTQWWFRS